MPSQRGSPLTQPEFLVFFSFQWSFFFFSAISAPPVFVAEGQNSCSLTQHRCKLLFAAAKLFFCHAICFLTLEMELVVVTNTCADMGAHVLLLWSEDWLQQDWTLVVSRVFVDLVTYEKMVERCDQGLCESDIQYPKSLAGRGILFPSLKPKTQGGLSRAEATTLRRM